MSFVEVEAARFAGWVSRFAERHGGDVGLDRDDDNRPVVTAADGARAAVDLVVDPPGAYTDLPGLVAHVEHPHRYALLLVRRGGWAVALADGTAVGDSRVGTKYVQGRTKAGGWSQQRFARRRAAQADSVVGAAAEAAVALLGRGRGRGRLLVTGGDRLLLRDTVAALASRGVTPEVARRRLVVVDPRRRVLDSAAVAACAARIYLVDPPA